MKRSPFIGGAAIGLMLALGVAAPAFAGPVEIVPWEDPGGTVVLEVGEEEWCPADVVDFEVTYSWEASGIDRITTQKNGIIRFASTFNAVDTYSANGKTFVIESKGNARDHKIIDNGDGTLTIWIKDSVLSTAWLDGEFLFHDSGLVSGAVIIDHNGTPGDPDDDTFLRAVDDFELHGRFDTGDRDFCEDIALFLGD